MFKQKSNNKIDTLISAKTRINGDVEFAGGFHLDGYINGNVKCVNAGEDTLSVSEEGCIEGSVVVPNIVLNGIVKGRYRGRGPGRIGPQGACFGQCSLFDH